MSSLRYWLTLSLTDNIGPILARRLIDATSSPAAACTASVNVLRQIEGIGTTKSNAIAASLAAAAKLADTEIHRAAAVGARIICPDDAEYPLVLNTIPDPPLVLYVKGELHPRDLHAVALVGSRKCSFYGREQAERFGALLGGAGVTVISGGARGIDSAAHRGALSHPHGRTVAVLGCGVNIAYPPENQSLFEQISQRGAVLSEYPIDTPPLAENFPKRNRIVSGMSRGVLVIEADERSGALITARQAGEDQGRPVFALPGRVDNKLSVGPHKLIRDGAVLVTNLQDILDELGPLPAEAVDAMDRTQATDPGNNSASHGPTPAATLDPAPARLAMELTATQQAIVDQLGTDPISIDQIAEAADLDIAQIMPQLTILTLRGVVRRTDGQNYSKTITRQTHNQT